MIVSKQVKLWAEGEGKGVTVFISISSEELGLAPKSKQEVRDAAAALDLETEIFVTKYAVTRKLMTEAEAAQHLAAYKERMCPKS